MLLILYWALIGFLSCIFGVLGMFAFIRETFGRKAFLVSVMLSGLLLMKISVTPKENELDVAEKFLISWKSESDNNGQSLPYIDDWTGLVDWDRAEYNDVPRDAYFSTNVKLESYGKPVLLSTTTMYLKEQVNGYGIEAGEKKMRLFRADVVINSIEMTGGKSMPTAAKFWIATDNNKIVKFTLY
jgi:hypothetical protein